MTKELTQLSGRISAWLSGGIWKEAAAALSVPLAKAQKTLRRKKEK
jgi:hypothetical protein